MGWVRTKETVRPFLRVPFLSPPFNPVALSTSVEVGHLCALTTSIFGRFARKAAAAASLWACARSVDGLRKLNGGGQHDGRGATGAGQTGILVHIVVELEGLLSLGSGVFRGRICGVAVLCEQLGLPPTLESVDHCDVWPQCLGRVKGSGVEA